MALLPTRRWFQFRVSTWLFLVATVALCIALAQSRRESQSLREILRQTDEAVARALAKERKLLDASQEQVRHYRKLYNEERRARFAGGDLRSKLQPDSNPTTP